MDLHHIFSEHPWGWDRDVPCLHSFFLSWQWGLANLFKMKRGMDFSKELKLLLITHLLFVYDIMIFGSCKVQEFKMMNSILDLYCITIGMQINMDKSNMLTFTLENDILEQLEVWPPFNNKNIGERMKYHGFDLKPCG